MQLMSILKENPSMSPVNMGRLSIAQQFDAEFVIYRLEEAGKTLLALPKDGYPAGWRSFWPEMVYGAEVAYGLDDLRPRGPAPSATNISRMDEAWCWLNLIRAGRSRPGAAELYSPHGGVMLRRIVLMRSLVSPIVERHLWSWRKIGKAIGANHESIKLWHAKGIDIIVEELRKNPY